MSDFCQSCHKREAVFLIDCRECLRPMEVCVECLADDEPCGMCGSPPREIEPTPAEMRAEEDYAAWRGK